MKQLLIFSRRLGFTQYLEQMWEDAEGCYPVFCDSPDELMNFLQLFEKIDVLILDRASGVDLSPVDEFLREKKRVTNLFNCEGNENWNELAENIKFLCHPENSPSEGFIGISINTLLHFRELPFSLFLKLESGKFIKRIHAYEEIDHGAIRNYQMRGMEELFFEKRFGRDYINLLLNNMVNRLDASYDEVDKKSEAFAEVFQTVHDIVSSIGMKPRIIAICESLMKNLVEEVEKKEESEAFAYLENLRTNEKMSFHYRFIQLTCFLAAHVHGYRKRTDDQEGLKVLVAAAFFSDISLKNPGQHHALVTNHPFLSAGLMEKSGIVSEEVLRVILEHHGDPEGETYPTMPDPRICEPARRLFVAQELAHAFLTQPGDNHWKVFREVFRKYEDTFLADYFLSFEQTFLNYEATSA